MARIITEPRKVIELDLLDIIALGYGTICCKCELVQSKLPVYYIAVLHDIMCKEYYDEWISKDHYLDANDLKIEDSNFNSVKKLLNL